MAHVEPGDARDEWEERRPRPTDTHDGEGRPYQVPPPPAEVIERVLESSELLKVFGDDGIEINGTHYKCSAPRPGVIELMKMDGTVYQVRRGWCSCPDYQYRWHKLKDRRCKHQLGCIAEGLLPPGPAPASGPALAPARAW